MQQFGNQPGVEGQLLCGLTNGLDFVVLFFLLTAIALLDF